MVDKDVVLEKVGNIQNCLKRIDKVTNNDPKTLDDLDTQDIFVLNLQRAIQSSIDLGAHVVSTEGLGLPDKLKDIFKTLRDNNIIDSNLSENMTSMVGFRNIAVHEYNTIEPQILKKILTDHLPDLEKFYEKIMKYFKI